MALAFSIYKAYQPVKGGLRSGLVDITLDTDYAANGWAIAGSDITEGLTLFNLQPGYCRGGYVLEWDHVNSKLLAYEAGADAAPLDECGNGEDGLADIVVRCRYEGA